MFVADSQLEDGLPPKDNVLFDRDTHAHRYETLRTLIAAYEADQHQFDRCRVYF